MNILGIHTYGHDTGAVLISEGRLLAIGEGSKELIGKPVIDENKLKATDFRKDFRNYFKNIFKRNS